MGNYANYINGGFSFHQVKVEEIENGLKITETFDTNTVERLMSDNGRAFFRTTNETDAITYQILDIIGEIYNFPALATEFILIDIDGTQYQSADGTELVENSLKLKPFVGGGGQSETEFDITSDLNVGNVAAGQVIPEGTNLQGFISLLVNKIFYPTFTAPSLTLTSNAGSREIGETFDLVLNSSFNRGAITVNGNFQDYRSGAATAQSVDGTAGASKTITGYVTLPNQNFSAITDFAEGTQPKDSKGGNFDAPLPAGSLTANTSFSGGLRRFAGQMNSAPSNGAQVRAALLGTSVLNGGNSFAITANGTYKNFIVAIPAGKTLATAITSNNENVKENFILQAFTTVPDAAGNSQNYKVYVMTTVSAFSAGLIINITIS